jgi:hypothetical protein
LLTQNTSSTTGVGSVYWAVPVAQALTIKAPRTKINPKYDSLFPIFIPPFSL